MNIGTATRATPPRAGSARVSALRLLVGSGDRIGLFVLPVLVVGVTLNVAFPSSFVVGGPPPALRAISLVALVPGVVAWVWSAVLILRNVPRGELITTGPYALVRHPLYTAVALLVAPWVGFLLDTWLGAAVGLALYVGSRLFSPAEEARLSAEFGAAWHEYRGRVRLPWL